MTLKLNDIHTIVGKVDNINQGSTFTNINVILEDQKSKNIKLDNVSLDDLYVGKLYQFDVIVEARNDTDLYLQCQKYQPVEAVFTEDQLQPLYETFYTYAPVPLKTIKKTIEAYLKKIKHPVIRAIVDEIYNKQKHAFYTHPAATKFHHAYVGGLAYHTMTMLKIADGFYDIYPYLDASLMIAGIVLHDMSKISEMTGVDGEYTKEGLLIGHLVMEAIDIDRTYHQLKLDDPETLLLLKHMMLSHHGLPNFGAAKRPQTPEALLLWYIDTIDSKFTVLGEELDKTKSGSFTTHLAVLDKQKFYKKS
ncbi:MAG: metal-dependent phosphohydrolase [Acholeplasmataceae bacterium]